MAKRNKACPCGSGKKHKNCCGEGAGKAKGREIPLSPQAVELLQRQIEMFREKFGRDPGPGDPVFFDPDAPLPMPFNVDEATAEIAKLMKKAGVRPQLIWAFIKTGMIVSEDNMHLLSEEDIDEWNEAIREYEENPERN